VSGCEVVAVPVPAFLPLEPPAGLNRLFPVTSRSAQLDHLLMEWLTAMLAEEGGYEALHEFILARNAGALFPLSTSGGKDSQAQALLMNLLVRPEQRLDIHASLGDLEWPGALEHARNTAMRAGVAFEVVHGKYTLTEMVNNRFRTRPDAVSWPSSLARYCTASLKTQPIDSFIRRAADQNGFTRIVSCLGMRADESPARAKKPIWKPHGADGAKGRRWSVFLPIHPMPERWVFEFIRASGEEPHPVYALGNKRLSCQVCIFSARSDLLNAARHRPEIVNRYIHLEDFTGYTMHQNRKDLRELTGLGPGEFHLERPADQGPRVSEAREFSALQALPLGKVE